MPHFDPERCNFVRLSDFELPGAIALFEYRSHAAVDGRADLLRLNIYLSRDRTFVTIWNGLIEPWLAEAQFDLAPAFGELNFDRVYHEPLFRGHIETAEVADVILRALRIDNAVRSLPQVLRGAPHDLRCEILS